LAPNIRPLLAIKLFHTVIWAFFAACIIAIPIVALAREFTWALVIIGIVLIEVLVILLNAWACPLTAVAARYTTDRRDNFDIYLPEWLARHNKTIFGSLYAGGVLMTAALWLGWVG
jgi:polyferredoxin